MDDFIKDLLPFYALGVLSEAEKEQVELYVSSHPEARQQFESETKVVSTLAYSAPPTLPSAELKRALMKRVQADVTNRNQTSAPVSIFARFFDNFNPSAMMPALTGLSLVIALLAGIWIFSLNTEVTRLHQQLTSLERTIPSSQTDISPIHSELEALRQENRVLQQELSDQQEKLSLFSRQVVALQEENSSLEKSFSAQNEALSAIRADLSLQPAEVIHLTELENQLSTQSQSISNQDQAIFALQQELTDLRETNARLEREISAQREIMVYVTSPNVQPMLLAGTTALPSAKGQLIANPNDATGALIISGLPPLAPGLVYQFWLVQGADGYVQAGVVDVDEEGVGTLIVSPNLQIGAFDAMGISVEAADQIPEPTRESMIMLGALSS